MSGPRALITGITGQDGSSCRAAAGGRLRGVGDGAAADRDRLGLAATSVSACTWSPASSPTRRACRPRWRVRRPSSTTWRPRASCPTPGAARPFQRRDHRRDRGPAGGGRDHSPATRLLPAAPARSSARPARVRSGVHPVPPRNPYAMAKLAAHLLVGQFGSTLACSPARRSCTTTSPSADRQFRLAQDHPRGGRDQAWAGGVPDARRHECDARLVVCGGRLPVRADAPPPGAPRLHLRKRRGRTVKDFLDVAFDHLGLEAEAHLRIDERCPCSGAHAAGWRSAGRPQSSAGIRR